MNPIGGYFELSIKSNFSEFHNNALALNTARNCFEYLILAKKIKKIYIPKFLCFVLLEPILKHKVDYEYYSVDENLEVVEFDWNIEEAYILLINYFGVKDSYIEDFCKRNDRVLLDLSQAFFFTKYSKNIDAFYSARKFFGVADGAYLNTENKDFDVNEVDVSYHRMSHLLKRIDLGPEDGYPSYKKNDSLLSNQPIKKMSRLTKRLLQGIDYEAFRERRLENFSFLHNALEKQNKLTIDLPLSSPLTYPFLIENTTLREQLIKYKIFSAQYWPELVVESKKSSVEYFLANNIIHLPIDHRYDIVDMKRVLSVISESL